MILERRREVAEHRIVFGGQRHQIGGIGRHDLVLAPIQVVEADRHVQRRADIQADGQPMELAHGDVLKAAPDQLLPALEDLRPNEAGNIVDVKPCSLGLYLCELYSHGPAEAIFSGFKHHHVDAVCRAVGEFGALAGFEVEAISLPFFARAYFKIFSLVMSKILLQSSVPARLWNIVATVPGKLRSPPPGHRCARARTRE